MKRLVLPLLSGLLLLSAVQAQTVLTPAPASESPALEPFVATYQVFDDGHRLGDATMQVVRGDGTQWRVDLAMKGRGLMRLTGLNVQQSTVFDNDGQRYRPLSQSTVKRALFSNRKSTGTYDWAAHNARWSGDIKPHRAGPITLRDGDMSGLLVNLAVIRDAEPGKTLHYRFVDDGRARDHDWQVAAQTEGVEIDGLRYNAMRVDRLQDDGEQTTLWIASGVPTPLRILQREDGHDAIDLRLIQYQGTQ